MSDDPADLHDADRTVLVAGPRPVKSVFEQSGDCIARYRLVAPLGEGGFGTVWLAEQVEPVTRQVALKIIKLGMDTHEVIARFEQERQALVMMDHAHIAKVLDAGATDSGRPFFVMELVRGVSITRFCDDHKLNMRQRLELFADVCGAIHHAHQKGIIHRDIKPSNVLVCDNGGKPLVKIIDFGIAKATQGKLTERTLMTSQEQIIGTPAYMSPEQASLTGMDVDTRSDIYSLGVLLYELLAGRPPFDPKKLISEGYHEMCRIIVEQEPPKPSARLSSLGPEDATALQTALQIDPQRLARDVRGDLDWIVMKALEKDRERRYETANEFALDLRRFLANEPVLASPPSAAYRFQKFAQRHRAALLGTMTLALVLIAATVISLWQAQVALDARQEAVARAEKEREARLEAEAVTNFVKGVFQKSDPSRGGRTITVAETLDQAVKELEGSVAMDVARRSSLESVLGCAYRDLGLYAESEPLLRKAHEYFVTSLGTDHWSSVQSGLDLARTLAGLGKTDEALKLREAAVAIRRRMLGPTDPSTLGAITQLSASYVDHNRVKEAIALNEEALQAARGSLGPDHHITRSVLSNLAACYASSGKFEEASKLMQQVLESTRRAKGAKHPSTLGDMMNLANCYAQSGRLQEAVKLFDQLVPLKREVLGPEHLETLMAEGNRALCLMGLERYEDAERGFKEVIGKLRKVLGDAHPQTLSYSMELGRMYAFDLNRHRDALALLQPVLPACRKAFGPGHPVTLDATRALATAFSHTGSVKEGAALLEELLPVMIKAHGAESSETTGIMSNLAMMLALIDRRDEGIAMLEKALAIIRRLPPREVPQREAYFLNLADVYERAGRKDEAAGIKAELQGKRGAR
ncbi:tetratricopeptide repeat protein [Prosthecobacter sp.]|jgi:serine/threonine protein kinase|uniref:tetratricopeptide repeat protein n=1 Tax=Prosthecobacter sp. TaxID=1965333 RepID=UPI003784DC4B